MVQIREVFMIHGSEFRFKRHLELWKEQNKQIKRVVIATLIFGFLVLYRVLIPFQVETENTRSIIKKIVSEKDSLEMVNIAFTELKNSLKLVQKNIADRPWENEKDILIQKFWEINQTGRSVNAQKVADTTINNITSIINSEIIQPLEQTIISENAKAIELPELSQQIKEFSQFIKRWQSEHLNVNWFGTISAKNQAIMELTEEINQRTRSLATLLQHKVSFVKAEIKNRNEQIETLSLETINVKKELQNILEDLLPKWLQGIISVEQMVQLYPLFLVLLILYSAWLAYSLSRHYHFVVDQMVLTSKEKADLAISSIWTITCKGKFGQFITRTTYILYILIIWFCFEWGMLIYNNWLSIALDHIIVDSPAFSSIFIWVSRLIFMGLLVFTIFCRHLSYLRRFAPGWSDFNGK